jgi:hypothetical protein
MRPLDRGGRRPRPPRNPGGRTCAGTIPLVFLIGPFLVIRGWLRDRRLQP